MTHKKPVKTMRLVKETLRRLDGDDLAHVHGGGETAGAVVLSQTRLAATPPTPFCDMSIR